MSKIRVLLALLALAVVLSLIVIGQRRRALPNQLAQARASLGTRQGAELLEGLALRYPGSPEVLFLRARQLRLGGQWGPALASLKSAAEHGWPPAQVEREKILIGAGIDFGRTEPGLQKLLDADPDDVDVRLALAFGLSRGQNLKMAEMMVQSVLDRKPDDGAALCLQGRIALQKNRPHEALPALEKAVQACDGKYYAADARLLLATCYLELGRFEASLTLFNRCRLDEPESPKVLFGIGRSAWYLNRWDEAAAAFEEVLRLQPDHLDALSQLAYIHEDRRDLAKAVGLLLEAARQDPTWYDLHFRIAKILRAQGKEEQAAQHFERAEVLKRHWAKPRVRDSATSNPYTGEAAVSLRRPLVP
jgi:tetratricopeptide (TPR) repeat protein